MTRICDGAFYGCTGLISITIPDSVTSIDNYAFNGCYSLKTVYYAGTKEQWESIYIGSNNYPLKNADIVFGACDASIDNAVYKDKEISFNDGKVHGETRFRLIRHGSVKIQSTITTTLQSLLLSLQCLAMQRKLN